LPSCLENIYDWLKNSYAYAYWLSVALGVLSFAAIGCLGWCFREPRARALVSDNIQKQRRTSEQLRSAGEESASKDLRKTAQHLLADIHEQHEKAADDRYAHQRGEPPQHDPIELQLHIDKRIASLRAIIAQSSKRLSWATLRVAILALLISSGSLWVAIASGQKEQNMRVACGTDYYAVLFMEIALIGLTLVALVKAVPVPTRRDRSGLEAEAEVVRGPKSRRILGVAYGFGSVIIVQLINASEALKGHKVLLSITNIAMLFYLCFLNGWSRNKIIEWIGEWESKPER